MRALAIALSLVATLLVATPVAASGDLVFSLAAGSGKLGGTELVLDDVSNITYLTRDPERAGHINQDELIQAWGPLGPFGKEPPRAILTTRDAGSATLLLEMVRVQGSTLTFQLGAEAEAGMDFGAAVLFITGASCAQLPDYCK